MSQKSKVKSQELKQLSIELDEKFSAILKACSKAKEIELDIAYKKLKSRFLEQDREIMSQYRANEKS